MCRTSALSPAELLGRVKGLLAAPRERHGDLEAALTQELEALDAADFEALLCAAPGDPPAGSPPHWARRLLLRVVRRRADLSAERLAGGGVSPALLVDVSEACRLTGLPGDAAAASRLLEVLLAWQPARPARADGRRLVDAITRLGVAPHMSDRQVDCCLDKVVAVAGQGPSARELRDWGALLPAWRLPLLKALLRRRPAPAPPLLGSLVAVAQDWDLHGDAAIFDGLRQLLDRWQDAEEAGADADPEGLPPLRLGTEQVVLVDGPEGERLLVDAAAAAREAATRDQRVRVAVDAEWRDPRPLSLLQIALSLARGAPATVFLVDLVTPRSGPAMRACRELLQPGPAHEVCAFSPHEDLRRLRLAGVLPLGQDHPPGWVDIQLLGWGCGRQPSLDAVVRRVLSATLDKRMQTSDWDRRPLLPRQLEYAALDACVLLQLRDLATPAAGSTAPAAAEPAAGAAPRLLLTDEKEHWRRYRAERGAAAAGPTARERNADLRFVLPSPLSRLVRLLRGVGLDTVVLADGAAPRELAQVALDEDRVLLLHSHKTQVPKAVVGRSYWLRSRDANEQLREVIDVFGVHVDAESLCGRCAKCNAWDWHLATQEEVRQLPAMALSPRTLSAYSEFWVCGGCGKVYWHGSMFETALDHFRKFLPEATTCGTPADLQQKYAVMKAHGVSDVRLRASMLRDEVLAPGAASAAADLLAVEGRAVREARAGPRRRRWATSTACVLAAGVRLLRMLRAPGELAGAQPRPSQRRPAAALWRRLPSAVALQGGAGHPLWVPLQAPSALAARLG